MSICRNILESSLNSVIRITCEEECKCNPFTGKNGFDIVLILLSSSKQYYGISGYINKLGDIKKCSYARRYQDIFTN